MAAINEILSTRESIDKINLSSRRSLMMANGTWFATILLQLTLILFLNLTDQISGVDFQVCWRH